MRSASGGATSAVGLSAAGAGLVAIICVALALSGLVFALLVPDEALSSVPSDLRPRTAALPLAMLSYAAVGAFIAAVQPRNPIGWIFCAVALMWELFFFGSGYTQYAVFASSVPLPGLAAIALLTANLWIVSGALIAIALLLFPDGRLLSPRWRVLPVLVAASTAFMVFVISVSPGGIPNRPYIPNPIGVPGTAEAIRFLSHDAFIVAWALTYALAAASLLVRYRRSGDVHRQQLKWIAFAGTGLVVVLLSMQAFVESPLKTTIDPAARNGPGLFGAIPAAVAMAAFPIAAGIAIVRYRLYDIDLIIKRTLVYATTSAAIAATFFAGIVAVQAVLRPIISGSELAVAASTLISIALFQPVRRRVQDTVDRRFDRARFDAARTLDVFADSLRDEVDLDALRAALLGAVQQTMAPAHASLWLRERVHRAELRA